jgi:predicted phosphodiesterase
LIVVKKTGGIMKFKKVLFAFIFLMLMIGVGSMNVNAVVNKEAYMISTGPGADASNSMTITWHSEVEGSFLLYVKKDVDPNFTDPFVAIPESVPIEHFDTKTGITHRVNKCFVRLDNLDSATEYLYKAGKDVFSDAKTFKTASNTESFSFLYMSDYHVYNPVPTRLQKAESIYNEAKKIDDIAFTLHGGDVVAYGSSYDYWESLMNSSFANEGMMAMTPGNHDFYNGSASFIGVGYFNNILTNPNNGAENVKNSSYYFRYNNVLFVSIDNESSTQSSAKLASQQAWFRQVMEENPSQYIITYNHRPFYNGSTSNAGHANTNRTNWSSLFDEYGVDLVLSGHDHVYVRTKSTYNGQVSENAKYGTVYITAPQIGDRPSEANPNSPYTNLDAVIGGNYSGGVVITVNPSNFTTKLINDSGVVLDTSKTYAKRDPLDYAALDRQALLDNISAVYNGDDKIGEISLSGNDYLYVESMKVLRGGSLVVNKKIGIDDRKAIIYNPVENMIHTYSVEVTFNDGEVLAKELTMKTTPPFGQVNEVELRKNEVEDINSLYFSYNFINRQVGKYKVYIDDDLYFEDVIADGEDSKIVVLEDIIKGTEYEIKLEIIDRLDDVVYTESLNLLDPIIELEDFSVNVPDTLYLGENGKLEVVAAPMNATYKDFLFTSSDDLVLVINEFGEYELISTGEVVITIKEENTNIEKNYSVIVEKKDFGIINDLTINDEEGYVLNIPHSFTNNQVDKLEVYIDSDLFTTVDVVLEDNVESVNLEELLAGNDYQIKVDVIDIFGDVLITKEIVYSVDPILVNDLEVTYNDKMIIDETQTLIVDVLPNDATYKNVTYLSLNSDIISVSNAGKLKALKGGVATIKIGVENNEFTKSITITVREKVVEININAPEEVRLGVDADYLLEIGLTPDVDVLVTYESSNNDILTIDQDGTLHPKKAGEAIITVSADGVTETITIEVLKQKGCANGATILALLPMAFGIVFFRRRKI